MRYLFFFSLAVLLSSCSLPGTQTETTGNTVPYKGTLFSLSVPKNWSEVKQVNLPNPKK